MIQRFIILLSFLLVAATSTDAQRIDTIKANPDAKPLRKIWQVTGGEFGGGKVGDGFGSVGDINGDSLEDWAVHWGTDRVWRIYYGSRGELSTTPVAVVYSFGAVPAFPIVGDFWGTGHNAIGFPTGHFRTINGTEYAFYELHIFRTDSNRLDTVPSAILDFDKMNPPTVIGMSGLQLQGADLDGDGDDELIMFTGGTIRDGVLNRHPELWIFRGGSEFQLDEPTMILRDSEENGSSSQQLMVIGHWDNDSMLDLVTGSDYSDGVNKLKFYFGRDGSPWNWTQPDRVVPMSNFTPLDCDGDGLLDMAVSGPAGNVSVFLSSSGKNIRVRSLSWEDADLRYAPYASPLALGYLSDSSRRFQMLGILGEGLKRGFSGGPGGPDPLWDTYSGEQWGGHRAIGDVTGDGWTELMTGISTVNFDAGISVIYAGGPYIPGDPSLGVRAVTGEGRNDAISIWPNPATTELHIAWRGDLKRMPRRFEIYNLLGQLVARGEVESWRGEALWQCGDTPAGIYVLSIQDYRGELIATTRVVKH